MVIYLYGGNNMALWKDSETVVDYLNFDYIIDAVVNIVLDEELSPSSIGLYGDWGSGKSSLMKMVETRLDEKGNDSIMCIKFNGWLFEGYEDAKTALCGTILEKMHDNKKLSAKAKEKIKTLWDKVDVQKILGKGIHLGLDFTDNKYRNEQISFFCELVERCRYDETKILSIHSRKAEKEVVEILKQGPICFRPILHWYSGNFTVLKEALEIGCYFSVNIRMLMSQKARRILEMIPIERLILETDSPFLSINVRHSNSLADVIVKLAQLKSMPVEVVEKNLWHNFECILKNC